MFVFFGSQYTTDTFPHGKTVIEHVVGVDVEFLLDFSLDIQLSRVRWRIGPTLHDGPSESAWWPK
ncbi:MAG: hypothetical protein R3B91_11180 [Planctomycetaceae bacterium]